MEEDPRPDPAVRTAGIAADVLLFARTVSAKHGHAALVLHRAARASVKRPFGLHRQLQSQRVDRGCGRAAHLNLPSSKSVELHPQRSLESEWAAFGCQPPFCKTPRSLSQTRRLRGPAYDLAVHTGPQDGRSGKHSPVMHRDGARQAKRPDLILPLGDAHTQAVHCHRCPRRRHILADADAVVQPLGPVRDSQGLGCRGYGLAFVAAQLRPDYVVAGHELGRIEPQARTRLFGTQPAH